MKLLIPVHPDIKPSISSYINKLNYNFLKRTMKLNTELQRPKRVIKLLYFFVILFLIGIGWVIIKTKFCIDINVQLSLLLWKKGIKG